VGRVRDARKRQPGLYEKIFDDIDALVLQSVSAIQENNIEALGEYMNINHGLLNALQVSSPELERLIGISRDAGALGAKLTGGGGGGAMIALCGDESAAESVRTALVEVGFEASKVTIGGAQ